MKKFELITSLNIALIFLDMQRQIIVACMIVLHNFIRDNAMYMMIILRTMRTTSLKISMMMQVLE
jgi:hypothetical protein